MLAIVTYDTHHLKTEQLVLGLIERGETISTLYALPFIPRPPRQVLFQHRPDQTTGRHPRNLAEEYGINYELVGSAEELRVHEPLALACVGVILPETAFANTRMLNCHPGLIPDVRGLDAFKWAILNDLPLGNTLHFIDREVDCGRVIHRQHTPVYATDTIEQLAARHYERELKLNINFRDHLAAPEETVSNEGLSPAYRRMPKDIEKSMLAHFSTYAKRFALPR